MPGEVQEGIHSHSVHVDKMGNCVLRCPASECSQDSLRFEIMNADLDIDMSDKLKALVTDPAYWKGVAAF